MKLHEFIKMEKKSQKPYLTDCNLFIAQDLWQAQRFEEQITKLNVKMNILVKNEKLVGLNRKIVTAFSNTQTLKMIK